MMATEVAPFVTVHEVNAPGFEYEDPGFEYRCMRPA